MGRGWHLGVIPHYPRPHMTLMNVTPDAAEIVVISHNHGDHTGGLLSVLEKNRKMTVFLPPSCPETMVRQAESLRAKVITVSKPVEICKGVYVIGPKQATKSVEQALVLDTGKGLVVCCNSGLPMKPFEQSENCPDL